MKKIISSLLVLLCFSSFAEDFYYWGGAIDDGFFFSYSSSPDPSSVSSVFGVVTAVDDPSTWGDDSSPIVYYTPYGDFSPLSRGEYNDLVANGDIWGYSYSPSSLEYADYPDPSSLPSSGGSGSVPTGDGFSPVDSLSSLGALFSGIGEGLALVFVACSAIFISFLVWRKFKVSANRS